MPASSVPVLILLSLVGRTVLDVTTASITRTGHSPNSSWRSPGQADRLRRGKLERCASSSLWMNDSKQAPGATTSEPLLSEYMLLGMSVAFRSCRACRNSPSLVFPISAGGCCGSTLPCVLSCSLELGTCPVMAYPRYRSVVVVILKSAFRDRIHALEVLYAGLHHFPLVLLSVAELRVCKHWQIFRVVEW